METLKKIKQPEPALSIFKLKIVSVYLFYFIMSSIVVAEENSDKVKAQDKAKSQEQDKSITQLKFNVDTTKWKCKYCPDNNEKLWFLDLEAGTGYVTNDSYKFSEYNGLQEKGPFLILDIDAMYRDENANYFDIKANNLGLDIRRLEMEGGKQGKYKLNLLIDNINRYQLDTSRTPYNGTTNQTLPGGWVKGLTTSGMTTLPSDLHNINFYTKRKNLKLSGSYIQNKNWNYDVKFNRQTKEGKTPFAATIGANFGVAKSAVLAKPVNYTTDNVELAANFNNKQMAGSISFIHSTFKNKNDSLTWDNAFSTGPGSGQISLEPDNEMQQFMVNGQYRGFENIMISSLFSYAKLKQNETFNPYTNNGALNTSALPEESLAGKVDVYNFNVNVNWSITDKSRIKFIYEHQEQANNTDRATYSYVIADAAITSTPRTNVPYSFRNQKFKVDTSYRLESNNKISGGFEYDLYDRTYQEVVQSKKSSLWTKYTQRIFSDVNYSIKLQGNTRKADSYNILTELNPAENPQLRKFNLADKDELQADFNVNFIVADNIFMNINIDYSNNDYSNSVVGLSRSDDLSAGIDVQYTITEELSFTTYLQQSIISSTQNGSTFASDPDWSAYSEDSLLTFGLGTDYTVIEDELSLGFNFVHTDANGKISLSGATATPLPDLTSRRDLISIYSDYNYNEFMKFRLRYDYEVYKEENWNLDSVTQGTIDNVLNLGEISPEYSIGVIWLSMKYLY